MAFRDIQCVEIVIIRLDLAVVLDRISHRDEDLFDTLPYDRDRMQIPTLHASAGKSYVNALGLGLCLKNCGFQASFSGINAFDDRALDRLNELAKLTSFLRRDLADELFRLGEQTLLARMTDAQCTNFAQQSAGIDAVECRLVVKFFEFAIESRFRGLDSCPFFDHIECCIRRHGNGKTLKTEYISNNPRKA